MITTGYAAERGSPLTFGVKSFSPCRKYFKKVARKSHVVRAESKPLVSKGSTPLFPEDGEEAEKIVMPDKELMGSEAAPPPVIPLPGPVRLAGLALGAIALITLLSAASHSLWSRMSGKKEREKEFEIEFENRDQIWRQKLKEGEEKVSVEFERKVEKMNAEMEIKLVEKEKEVAEKLQQELNSKFIFEKQTWEDKLKLKEVEVEQEKASAQEFRKQLLEMRAVQQDLMKQEASFKKSLDEFQHEYEEKLKMSEKRANQFQQEYEEKLKLSEKSAKQNESQYGKNVAELENKIVELETVLQDKDDAISELKQQQAKEKAPTTDNTVKIDTPKPSTEPLHVPTHNEENGIMETEKNQRQQTAVLVEEEVPVLSLIAAGTIIPHVKKVEKGGEDAFFISQSGYGAIGVADGVGGWASDGIDPAIYPRQLMQAACKAIDSSPKKNGGVGETVGALEAVEYAHKKAEASGSCTACVARLKSEGGLEIANLGDCGVRIVRNGECVFSTQVQEHEFNMPFQMGNPDILPDTDYPVDADLYDIKLEENDVVIMGSDGLFDNIWSNDLAQMVEENLNGTMSEEAARKLSRMIAEAAHSNAKSSDVRTPWAVESAAAGVMPLFERMFPRGGKMDDCTVVVGFATTKKSA